MNREGMLINNMFEGTMVEVVGETTTGYLVTPAGENEPRQIYRTEITFDWEIIAKHHISEFNKLKKAIEDEASECEHGGPTRSVLIKLLINAS